VTWQVGDTIALYPDELWLLPMLFPRKGGRMETVKVWGIYGVGWVSSFGKTYWTMDKNDAACQLKQWIDGGYIYTGEVRQMPDELVATIPEAAVAAIALAEMRRADLALLAEVEAYKAKRITRERLENPFGLRYKKGAG